MFIIEKSTPQPSPRDTVAYQPLLEEGTPPAPSRHDRRMSLYLILEAIVLTGLFGAYLAFTTKPPACIPEPSPITFSSLSNYNKTEFFTENNDMMLKTPEAEKFWIDMLRTDGVVSVPKEWALDMGLTKTLDNPDRAGHGVYQVDMYHSLHCLHHIRLRLVSKVPLDKWPRDDKHTLHCINYIRQQVMCHADITLGGTDDVLHYGLDNGHRCRDYEAVVRWTKEHEWKGHAEWIEKMYGYKAGAENFGA